MTLKDKIKDMIQKRYLKEFVAIRQNKEHEHIGNKRDRIKVAKGMQKVSPTIYTIFRSVGRTLDKALCTHARIARYPHIVYKVNLA